MPKIYNTLTRTVDDIIAGTDGKIRMFVCGPTVFNYIHIGNARTFVIFDMVAKYLRWRNYDVHYIQNITDVDDKIIAGAAKENKNPKEFAAFYEEAFLTDTAALGITAPDQYVRATDHIQDILQQVKVLVEKEYAYEISDGIYFDLSKFQDYGKLSGRTTLSDDDAVSRVDDNPEKRHPGDFCLWKRSKNGEPSWPSPWFPGRPGWHIEDTAITESVFGPQYDLHGGAQDLIFPHHEAEIAQQEAASGKTPLVRYWMHPAFLVFKDEKMSKSIGNIRTARELLTKYSIETLRLYLLSGHWRSPLEFSETALKQAEAGTSRIAELIERLRLIEENKPLAHKRDHEIAAELEGFNRHIIEAMDDNLNTPKAIAILFDMMHTINQHIDEKKLDLHSVARIMELLDFYRAVMGIIPVAQSPIPQEIQILVQARQEAKKENDFNRSDRIREQLKEHGYTVDDTPYGPLVKKLP